MKTILMLMLMALPDGGVSEKTEAFNQGVVDEGNDLCKKSSCSECGVFSWDYCFDWTLGEDIANTKKTCVAYTPSRCEEDFTQRLVIRERNKQDTDIRKKYERKK